MFVDFFFFFKQKTAYEIRNCDWSSDVCSSDLCVCVCVCVCVIVDVGQPDIVNWKSYMMLITRARFDEENNPVLIHLGAYNNL